MLVATAASKSAIISSSVYGWKKENYAVFDGLGRLHVVMHIALEIRSTKKFLMLECLWVKRFA